MVTSLSVRVGGLSLYSTIEVDLYALMTSMVQSWVLHNHILRDSEICGTNLDFDKVLDDLSAVISDFDLSSFISKDTCSTKTHHVWTIVLFSKSVHDMYVKFDMTTR